MIITLWNHNLLSKSDFLGCVRLVPMRICPEGNQFDGWFEMEHLLTPRYRNTRIIEGAQIRLQITWSRLIDKIVLVHYGFDDKLDKSGQRFVRDISGRGIHLRLKNLDTDDIETAPGVISSGKSAYFSGFNFIESSLNPTRSVTEFSISFWFKCEDVDKEFIMLSTVTTNKSIILQEYNSNLIHQLNTDNASGHLEKLYRDEKFSSHGPTISLSALSSSSTGQVGSPRLSGKFSLSVTAMDEKKTRRLSMTSLMALNSSFNVKKSQ